jgi:hypothetical protein
MDWVTVITATTSSFGVSIGTAHWLGKAWIKHRFARDLEERKSELARHLEAQKAVAASELERLKNSLQLDQLQLKSTMEANVRKEVETQLGELGAQRQYEYDARRRLYLAIGPLRFQLLLACRDFAGRVHAMGEREKYAFELDGYYARSTIYRVLKPIALAALIEEQMTITDFSVDKDAIDILRFGRAVKRIFSGHELVEGHPNVNWLAQVEHLYADSLSSVAQALIDRGNDKNARILRFEEFNNKVESAGWLEFWPLDALFDNFDASRKPILWLRLVAYAQVCNNLVARQGRNCGFGDDPFDTATLLSRSGDAFIQPRIPTLLEKISKFETMAL